MGLYLPNQFSNAEFKLFGFLFISKAKLKKALIFA